MVDGLCKLFDLTTLFDGCHIICFIIKSYQPYQLLIPWSSQSQTIVILRMATKESKTVTAKPKPAAKAGPKAGAKGAAKPAARKTKGEDISSEPPNKKTRKQ